jgi:hypothetical protein
MPALRADGLALGPTVNDAVPSPCPEAEPERASHAASLFAVHSHSRFVEIVMDPDPPPDENAERSTFASTAHFTVEGEVTVVVSDEEPQDAHASAEALNTIAYRSGLHRRRGKVIDTCCVLGAWG